MKIAYILAENIDPNGTSGASSHIRENIKWFERIGHEVFLVSDYKETVNLQEHKITNKSLFQNLVHRLIPEFAKLTLRSFRIKAKNRNLFEKNKELIESCDIIYERDAFESFEISKYRQFKKIPWIIECNGFVWSEMGSIFHKSPIPCLYKKLQIFKWQRADRIIVVCSNLKDKIVAEGIDPDKVTVIHNGVNLDAHMQISETDLEHLRQKFGLENQVTIGFLGHILPKHRIDILLESIKILNDCNYPVKGFVVGGGTWNKYQQQAQTMGIADKIAFTGPVQSTQVPLMVAAMDICTLPGCHDYDSPVKLFDYGAAKRPVVAANFPNVQEIIADGDNGLLFKPNSINDFIEKLKILIEEQELRKNLGEKLYKKVEMEHTWQKVAERSVDIFNKVIKDSNL